MGKKAIITGITGQDGSYLAELLIEKKYEVYGLVRRSSSFNRGRIEHIYNYNSNEHSITLFYGDMADASSLNRILEKVEPDEIYNLAAQSHVGISFQIPEYTADVTALGCLRLLDTIREVGLKTRYYQASSSELFGKVQEIPQKETTPFYPRSPYACAKAFAFDITRNYREAYNLFACNGILFNHESPRRGENFVSRKITNGFARIKYNLQNKLVLGNLYSKRDWGYAKDYVEAMWLMLQQEEPDDYVIASGETYSVKEFVETAGKMLDFDIVWEGSGMNEKGIDTRTGKIIVEVSEEFYRPSEVDFLLGDPSKAMKNLGWNPRKTSFKELVKLMVESDIELARKEAYLRGK